MTNTFSPERAPAAHELNEQDIVNYFITPVEIPTETGNRQTTVLAELLTNPTRMLGHDLTAAELDGIKNVLRGFKDNKARHADFIECSRLLGRYLVNSGNFATIPASTNDFDDEPTDPDHLRNDADFDDDPTDPGTTPTAARSEESGEFRLDLNDPDVQIVDEKNPDVEDADQAVDVDVTDI